MQIPRPFYTVSMFGHRTMTNPDDVADRLHRALCDVLTTHAQVCFLLGQKGQFDEIAVREIAHAAQTTGLDPAQTILVLPYLLPEYAHNPGRYAAAFDCVWVMNGDPRTAYDRRNAMMLDRSDHVIFAVEHPSGGAYAAMWYAKSHDIPYTNLLHNPTVSFEPVDIDLAVAD